MLHVLGTRPLALLVLALEKKMKLLKITTSKYQIRVQYRYPLHQVCGPGGLLAPVVTDLVSRHLFWLIFAPERSKLAPTALLIPFIVLNIVSKVSTCRTGQIDPVEYPIDSFHVLDRSDRSC